MSEIKHYSEEGIDLYCADCLEKMRDIPDKSIDLVLTDPPYNVGIQYGKETNDNMSEEQFVEWAKQRFSFLLKYPTCICVGIKNLLVWKNITDNPQWVISWIKRNGQGHTKLGGTNKWDAILCYNLKPDNGIDIIDVNNDYSEGIKSMQKHPTAKPSKLFKILSQRFSKKGDTILDPFMGSGTTGVACKELGRNFIDIEISEKYFDIAVNRIKNTQRSLF